MSARIAAIAVLLVSAPVLAFKPEDLERARQFAAKAQHVNALIVLRPCLKEGSEQLIPPALLEECLALGDETVVEAVSKGPERDDGTFVRSMQRVGVKVKQELYGHSYDHAYLARLQKLFPKSKYADHAAYFVNPHGEGWRGSTRHLEGYLARYPNGIYARSALLWLAMTYDNLWDYTRPETRDEMGPTTLGTDTGDPAANAKLAEEYRQKAIDYYGRATTHRGDDRDETFQPFVLDQARKRLPGIMAKEPSSFVVVYELRD